MTSAPKPPSPAHGWRITLPMVVGWLTTASAVASVIAAQAGVLHLPGWVQIVALILATVVANLNHSPLPTPGGGNTPGAGKSLVLLLAGTVGLATILHGCGGATAQTRTAFATQVAICVANERSIIDRAGTTAAQDQADMTAERARCDSALAAITGGN